MRFAFYTPASLVALAGISLAVGGTPVLGRDARPFLPVAESMEAPRGFVAMCETDRAFCSATHKPPDSRIVIAALAGRDDTHPSPAAMALLAPVSVAPGAAATNAKARPSTGTGAFSASPISGDEAKLLNRINRYVNSRVQQHTDWQIFGRDEVWARSGVGRNAVGDCEDIAIEKRYELVAEGFPANRLAFAVVYSRASGLHTVLVARTERTDVVLDSRSPYVRTWSEADYSWISVQSMDDPGVWRRVS